MAKFIFEAEDNRVIRFEDVKIGSLFSLGDSRKYLKINGSEATNNAFNLSDCCWGVMIPGSACTVLDENPVFIYQEPSERQGS